MAILELRAARGWSLKQTADTFLVTPVTVISWMKRINEKGPDALGYNDCWTDLERRATV
jgi:transposase